MTAPKTTRRKKYECIKCNKRKYREDFRMEKRNKTGIAQMCKSCRVDKFVEDGSQAQQTLYFHVQRSARAGVLSLLTVEDVKRVKETKSCSYCGCKLTPRTAHLDHILPLSGKFENVPGNVTAACKPCNSRKQNRNVYEFMVLDDYEGLYGEKRFVEFCRHFAEINEAPDSWQAVRDAFITDYILVGREPKRSEAVT